MPLPLPSDDDNPEIEEVPEVGIAAPVPTRSTRVISPGDRLYVLQIRLVDQEFSSLIHLIHKDSFDDKELGSMFSEATRICNEVRLVERRKRMLKDGTQIPKNDWKALNERWFESDADFVAGVMCDKFNFRIAKYVSTSGTIETTVKGSA